MHMQHMANTHAASAQEESSGQECGDGVDREDGTQHCLSASLNDSLADALAAEGFEHVTGEMFLTMSAAEQATVLASLSEAHRIGLLQHITESLSGAANACLLSLLPSGKLLAVLFCAHHV